MTRITTYHVTKKVHQAVIEKITAVLRQETGIEFAFIYGSFLHEQQFRDIDLGLFVKGMPASDYLDIELRFSQSIQDALSPSYPVDVKVINGAPLSFCFHVIRGELLLFRDEEFLVRYMTRTARAYLDMAILRHHSILEAMA